MRHGRVGSSKLQVLRSSLANFRLSTFNSSIGRLFSHERGAEFVLGAAILLVILSFAVYSTIHQSDQSEHYGRARQAIQAHQYEQALAEYDAASGYLDTPQRSAELRNQLASRDMLYEEALDSRKAGKWWLEAVALSKVAELQPGYKDVTSQLAGVRQENGLIFYKQAAWANGIHTAGLFFAWAAGGEPHHLPRSNASSTIQAVSPDSRWIVYSIDLSSDPQGVPHNMLLYDLHADAVYSMLLPSASFTTPILIRFSPDSRQVWLDMGDSPFSYPLPFAVGGPSTLVPQLPDAAENAQRYGRSLLLSRDAASGASTLSLKVAGPAGASPRLISVEQGRVDGAIFSSDGHFLLYRVWSSPDNAPDSTCRLKLVDLTLQTLHADTIAGLPIRAADEMRSSLKGEFTRDGVHVLLVQRYRGDTEAHLYTLGTGNAGSFSDMASDKLALALSTRPTIAEDMPGLAAWEGSNSLASSEGTVQLAGEQVTWAKHYIAFGHWVAVSPSNMYVLYLDSDAKAGASGSTNHSYSLYATPFSARQAPSAGGEDQGNTRLILRTSQSPLDWLSSIHLLPDGQTLLSTVPPSAGSQPGLYSYDLQTGKSTLALPGVTNLWPSGG